MSDWICIGNTAETRRVVGIEVAVYPDQKFGCASLKVDARTDCGNRVRLFTKAGRGLRLRECKSDVAKIFEPIIGKLIFFKVFENFGKNPDLKVRMRFPVSECSERLAFMKKEASALFQKPFL